MEIWHLLLIIVYILLMIYTIINWISTMNKRRAGNKKADITPISAAVSAFTLIGLVFILCELIALFLSVILSIIYSIDFSWLHYKII